MSPFKMRAPSGAGLELLPRFKRKSSKPRSIARAEQAELMTPVPPIKRIFIMNTIAGGHHINREKPVILSNRRLIPPQPPRRVQITLARHSLF